ncbi:hypothetical protein FNF28_05172 [Cafeteria roenbergensis]|uniref:Uncharacterized protein n=1 Tax=Cafeteria roenbergensis TaxID=33653 RepID=A0A5A8D952_CAFRO|nr:hypothetical protein FNF28_05172 [Cafeteria roenbergensis]
MPFGLRSAETDKIARGAATRWMVAVEVGSASELLQFQAAEVQRCLGPGCSEQVAVMPDIALLPGSPAPTYTARFGTSVQSIQVWADLDQDFELSDNDVVVTSGATTSSRCLLAVVTFASPVGDVEAGHFFFQEAVGRRCNGGAATATRVNDQSDSQWQLPFVPEDGTDGEGISVTVKSTFSGGGDTTPTFTEPAPVSFSFATTVAATQLFEHPGSTPSTHSPGLALSLADSSSASLLLLRVTFALPVQLFSPLRDLFVQGARLADDNAWVDSATFSRVWNVTLQPVGNLSDVSVVVLPCIEAGRDEQSTSVPWSRVGDGLTSCSAAAPRIASDSEVFTIEANVSAIATKAEWRISFDGLPSSVLAPSAFVSETRLIAALTFSIPVAAVPRSAFKLVAGVEQVVGTGVISLPDGNIWAKALPEGNYSGAPSFGPSTVWAIIVDVRDKQSRLAFSAEAIETCSDLDLDGLGESCQAGNFPPVPLVPDPSVLVGTRLPTAEAEFGSTVTSIQLYTTDGRRVDAPHGPGVIHDRCFEARFELSRAVNNFYADIISATGADVKDCADLEAQFPPDPTVLDPDNALAERSWRVSLYVRSDIAVRPLGITVSVLNTTSVPHPRIFSAATSTAIEYRAKLVAMAFQDAPGATGSLSTRQPVTVASTVSTSGWQGWSASSRLILSVSFESPVSGFSVFRDLALTGFRPVREAVPMQFEVAEGLEIAERWSVELEVSGKTATGLASVLPFSSHSCESDDPEFIASPLQVHLFEDLTGNGDVDGLDKSLDARTAGKQPVTASRCLRAAVTLNVPVLSLAVSSFALRGLSAVACSDRAVPSAVSGPIGSYRYELAVEWDQVSDPNDVGVSFRGCNTSMPRVLGTPLGVSAELRTTLLAIQVSENATGRIVPEAGISSDGHFIVTLRFDQAVGGLTFESPGR